MKWMILAAAALLAGCGGVDYDPMRFEVEGDRIVALGVIDGSTPAAFREVMADAPDATDLELRNVPGSADDEANLQLARLVRDAGLSTIVPADGMVASGGTDLFLAGVDRVLQPGACVGVHSWATGDGDQGRDVPRDDPQHQLYLSYYDDMDIPAGFYWFTLDAAPAEGIYWMSADDVLRFNMVENARDLGVEYDGR